MSRHRTSIVLAAIVLGILALPLGASSSPG